ncbi:MAG: DUF3299 domain-containing protein [Alcanivoracaceae bacterium]|nr:DUF3299 domain-containing protein [Alcanivoracaceae bacterium]
MITSFMKARRLSAILIVWLGLLNASMVAAQTPRELEWDDLVPADWQPQSLFEEFAGITEIEDGDPIAERMMQRIREVWDQAPLVAELDGKHVRMPGYAVPLDGDAEQVRTFLLVPYFGACIHTPPPPRNQIVLVQMKGQGVPIDDAFGALWITGTLKVEPAETEFGLAGYTLNADKAEVIEF